jgi:hypothetical protein
VAGPAGVPYLSEPRRPGFMQRVQGARPPGGDLREHPGLPRRQSLLRGNEDDQASGQQTSFLSAATPSLRGGGKIWVSVLWREGLSRTPRAWGGYSPSPDGPRRLKNIQGSFERLWHCRCRTPCLRSMFWGPRVVVREPRKVSTAHRRYRSPIASIDRDHKLPTGTVATRAPPQIMVLRKHRGCSHSSRLREASWMTLRSCPLVSSLTTPPW